MRILSLTWEFPPIITGGLAMACYGMVKELLNQGVEVELVVPYREPVYFQLRKSSDADNILAVCRKHGGERFKTSASAEELKKLIGSPLSVYASISRSSFDVSRLKEMHKSQLLQPMLKILDDDHYLFRQVRDYTVMAVDVGLELDFNLIHAHDWLSYPAGMILKTLTGKPLVVHVHATEFDRAGGVGDGKIHDIEYMGMQYADKVITVSEYTAKTVIDRYQINRERIRVVHNAYLLSNQVNNYKRIFDEPTILFMGRITLQKGPDYFLEVAKRIIAKHKNVRFVMAGAGDMETHILHKAAAMGLGTKFLTAGFLERHEVERILGSADIFLLPSVSEPFGIAPLEAMSYGAVAIVSKTSGVAEVIHNAYKIDFWDIDQMVATITELIEDPEKFKQMSMLSRQEVANLKWKDAVEKILNVFNELEEVQRC